jgi:nucleoid DNA-binding protein
MTTKAYVINNLAADLGITKKAAAGIYTAVTNITYRSLKESGVATVPGVGRLKVKAKPARMGRNPKTGQPVPISARKVLKLAPSKVAKLRVNLTQE